MAAGRTYLRNPERNQRPFHSCLADRGRRRDGTAARHAARRQGRDRARRRAARHREWQDQPAASTAPASISSATRASSSCFYPRGNPGERYRYSPPIALDDGWPVSTLEKEGIDRAAIERFVQMLIDTADGRPQRAPGPQPAHRPPRQAGAGGIFPRRPPRRAARSALGFQELDGDADRRGDAIGRADPPRYAASTRRCSGSVPADLDPRKKAMTLEHLITMTAGFDCDDSAATGPATRTSSSSRTSSPTGTATCWTCRWRGIRARRSSIAAASPTSPPECWRRSPASRCRKCSTG